MAHRTLIRLTLLVTAIVVFAGCTCNGNDKEPEYTTPYVPVVPSTPIVNDGLGDPECTQEGNNFIYSIPVDENLYGNTVEDMFRDADVPVAEMIKELGGDEETRQMVKMIKEAKGNLVMRFEGHPSETHHDFTISYTEL